MPLRTLDSLVAEAGFDRVDLLKIDVEGHEAAVLAGAEQTLHRPRPVLIFESGHESPAERGLIADRLDACSYDIVAVLHHYGALNCALPITGPPKGPAPAPRRATCSRCRAPVEPAAYGSRR